MIGFKTYLVRTYINLIQRKHPKIFRIVFTIQRANQASGRPIQKESDKGAIVFMDSRFNDKRGWISEWVRNEIKILPDRKNVISTVFKKFWNRRD